MSTFGAYCLIPSAGWVYGLMAFFLRSRVDADLEHVAEALIFGVMEAVKTALLNSYQNPFSSWKMLNVHS
jgi:hypothetical protein